jgi:hypothetical protein
MNRIKSAMTKLNLITIMSLATACTFDVHRVDYAWTGANCAISDTDIKSLPNLVEIEKHSISGEWTQDSGYGRYWYARECCSIEGARFLGWETVPGSSSEVAPMCLFGRGSDKLSGAKMLRERIREERRSGADRASGVVYE